MPPMRRSSFSEWVVKKAEVNMELLDTVKARKLAYYGHTMRKPGSCLVKEIMQGTMPGACRRTRPGWRTWDNMKMWTGVPVVRGRVIQNERGQR